MMSSGKLVALWNVLMLVNTDPSWKSCGSGSAEGHSALFSAWASVKVELLSTVFKSNGQTW